MPKVIITEPKIAYRLPELVALHPEAYDRAYTRWEATERQFVEEVRLKEHFSSMATLIKVLGFSMRDYNFGDTSREVWVKLKLPSHAEGTAAGLELTGTRAYTYIVNALDNVQYVPWLPITKNARRRNKETYARPWNPIECPLTGYFTDEDNIKTLKNYVLGMYNLEMAIQRTWIDACIAYDKDVEESLTEIAFREECDATHWFYEDGSIAEIDD